MVGTYSNVASSKDIEEMIKRLELYAKNIPAELSKENSMKPSVSKFKNDFPKILEKAQPMLEMARTLEKNGINNSKKQMAEFRLKFTVR